MKTRFLPAAAAEVDEAVAWYDAQREGLGAEFAEAVVESVGRAKKHPLAWKPVSDRLKQVP